MQKQKVSTIWINRHSQIWKRKYFKWLLSHNTILGDHKCQFSMASKKLMHYKRQLPWHSNKVSHCPVTLSNWLRCWFTLCEYLFWMGVTLSEQITAVVNGVKLYTLLVSTYVRFQFMQWWIHWGFNGSHIDWKTWKKFQSRKNRGILPKILEKSENF